jgi:sushi domain-containing protein 2
MLGGEVVNVTGPCFEPESTIYCRFDIWKVKGKYINRNMASCIVPFMLYEGKFQNLI